MKRILWSALLSLALVVVVGACAPSDPDVESVDPAAHYGFDDPVVAIGNSLTAGYMNSGVVLQGQLQGYANLVANQFIEGLGEGVTVAPGLPPMAMSMPLVDFPGIGITPGRTLLYVSPTGAVTTDPLTVPVSSLLLASALLQPYANLGVPGALTLDVATRLGAKAPAGGPPLPDNPFFDLVLRNTALPFNEGPSVSEVTPNGTQLGQFLQIVESPYSTTALMLLWIGNNDILLPAGAGSDLGIPPVTAFQAALAPVVAEIAGSDVPMVAIASIPEVSSTPAFTTVVGLLAQGGLDPADVNTDEADVRLILLSALGTLFPGGSLDPDYLDPGSGKSLPANQTLTQAELTGVLTRTAEYNAHIESVADANGWAHVDVTAALAELAANSPLPGPNLNAAYPWTSSGQNRGSAFALDGVHPSEKGYAFVANLFIDAVNAQYQPVLNALRGGPMDNVDVVATQNLLGFEQAPSPMRAEGRVAPVVDPARWPREVALPPGR